MERDIRRLLEAVRTVSDTSILFINKMDQLGQIGEITCRIKGRINENCIDFSDMSRKIL